MKTSAIIFWIFIITSMLIIVEHKSLAINSDELYIYNNLSCTDFVSNRSDGGYYPPFNCTSLVGKDFNVTGFSTVGKIDNAIRTQPNPFGDSNPIQYYILPLDKLGFIYGGECSLNFWFNTTYSGLIYLIDSRGSGGYYSPSLQLNGDTITLYIDTVPAGSFSMTSTHSTPLNDGVYHMFTLIKTGGECADYKLYIDNITQNMTCSSDVPHDDDAYYSKMVENFQPYGCSQTYADTIVACRDIAFDEISEWNRSLSVRDVSDLWNNGTGLTYPFISCIPNWIENDTQCNGFNLTRIYYDENDCDSNYSLPIDNGTIYNCTCDGNWTQLPQPCINGVRFVVYTNNIGCMDGLPSDNGTYVACTTPPNNLSISFSEDATILLIMAFFMIVSLICAIAISEHFFGLCALILGFSIAVFQQYHYPQLLTILSAITIIIFVVMWVFVNRAKR